MDWTVLSRSLERALPEVWNEPSRLLERVLPEVWKGVPEVWRLCVQISGGYTSRLLEIRYPEVWKRSSSGLGQVTPGSLGK
jgi:hypothetical protein